MQPARVLFASYYFPPDTAVGGLRAAKFARTLPEFGCPTVVLTAREGTSGTGLDAGRLHGLERVVIVRTREWPRLRDAYIRFKRWAASLRSHRSNGGTPERPGPSRARRRETPVQRLKRYFVSLVVLMPDDKKTWALLSAVRALRLIRKNGIGCVVTSAPPLSVNAIGLIAKALTGVRWIADFRDPWLESLEKRAPAARSRLADAVEARMERIVVRYADRVVTTTLNFRDLLRRRYAQLPADKFVCIPNSIDTDLLGAAGCVDTAGPLTITYAGTLYFQRTPEPLFAAVSGLIREGRVRREEIRINLLGHCRQIEGVDTDVVVREHGLEGVVRVIDFVPHAEAVRLMRRSHLLLVLAPENHDLLIPAKVYDYLGTGRHILALAGEGATADLIRETASGACFSPSDVAGLRDYLAAAVRDRAMARAGNNVDTFHSYHVRPVTAQLAAEINALCPVRPARIA